jgi:hypothetical protein
LPLSVIVSEPAFTRLPVPAVNLALMTPLSEASPTVSVFDWRLMVALEPALRESSVTGPPVSVRFWLPERFATSW